MKKTRYKACLLISELDDGMILEAELTDMPACRGRRRSLAVLQRVLLVAACVALLTVGAAALLLPAMLRKDPALPPETEGSQAATVPPSSATHWVSDPTLVKVERLHAAKATADAEFTVDGDLISAQTQTRFINDQLILLHFSCRENERVIVETSTDRSALNSVYPYTAEGGKLPRSCWRYTDGELDGHAPVSEELDYTLYKDRFGRPVTVENGDVLLWQYANLALPCAEDNFVDFTVVDYEGNVTGGGSIYIAGLDLTEMSANPKYYGVDPYSLNERDPFESFCFTNAIYRPVVLGAYRYTNPGGADDATQDRLIEELHALAPEQRETLFTDLDSELLRVSVREALIEYAYVIGKTGGWGFTSVGKRGSEVKYLIMSFVNSLDPADHEHLLFLYEGTYRRITGWEVQRRDEYGDVISGCLHLEDGTLVLVDQSSAEEPVTLLPPAETETS